MDIDRPEIDTTHEKPLLWMYCPEERIPREIFWAGFGFQVWCQMLTYIVRGKNSSLFLIDEPDIYLHADLQRQLLGILKTLGPDILVATHSTEIITEADPDDLVVVNKRSNTGRRIRNPAQLQSVFQVLGSNLNPVLTQLAKTKRALFVEGKDFQIISRFARKLGRNNVANRSDFAVIPVEGFNPSKVRDFIKGIETTLGTTVLAGAVFDRDYRSPEECKKEVSQLKKHCFFARIHGRKELENFLLIPGVLQRAVDRRLTKHATRTGTEKKQSEEMRQILHDLTGPMKHAIQAKYLARRREFEKTRTPSFDASTIDEELLKEFEELWENDTKRLLIVPGKDALAAVNTYLQSRLGITLSSSLITQSFLRDEIPEEMIDLIEQIDDFSKRTRE